MDSSRLDSSNFNGPFGEPTNQGSNPSINVLFLFHGNQLSFDCFAGSGLEVKQIRCQMQLVCLRCTRLSNAHQATLAVQYGALSFEEMAFCLLL